MSELVTIILAAGEGTRMHSKQAKVLHEVGGLSIVGHVVRAALGAGASRLGVVTAPAHDQVRAAVAVLAPDVEFFEQAQPKGTGHAAAMARPLWQDATGYVAVVYGDHPLLRPECFDLVRARLDAGMDAAILGFKPADPTGYGRFITDGERLLAIREHRDASPEERRIGLCNACILAFRAEVFKSLIDSIGTANSQGEYYVSDMVELANAAGHKVGYAVAPERDVMGVNDRAQLARAEGLFQEVKREEAMAGGATLRDPATTYFSYDTQIGKDVVIEPGVFFGPGVRVGDGAVIHAFSHIVGAEIGAGASVGPFARLRPEAKLAAGAKVGNFVEIKKANIGVGAKVSHLTYIGDADVGAGVNIGAGTITCNYDGINKHRTVIGAGVFVGSNSSLVAPVTIGDGAYIASGSVVTRNVEADALVVARSRQENKPGYASKLRARAEAIRKAKQK